MAVHFSQLPQQFQMTAALAGCGIGVLGDQAAALFPQTVVPQEPPVPPVFSEPESELTCNLSGSRKRGREGDNLPLLQTASSNPQMLYQQFLWQKQQQTFSPNTILPNKATQLPSLDLPVDSSRVDQSMMTSTSGRPPMQQLQSDSTSPTISNIVNNNNSASSNTGAVSSSGLISMLHYQSLEVDALVRNHTEKLRSVLEEARKRQCRAVVAAVSQQAQRRIAEKQAELDAATMRNAELEERLRQASAESQAWFNVARNSEALVAGLRASLEQALLQKLNGGDNDYNADDGDLPGGVLLEGYGDSEEEAVDAAAAASSVAAYPYAVRCPAVVGDSEKPTMGVRFSSCRSCGGPGACVVVLPCRHLCLCQSCDTSVDECPVCQGRKNGGLHINVFPS